MPCCLQRLRMALSETSRSSAKRESGFCHTSFFSCASVGHAISLHRDVRLGFRLVDSVDPSGCQAVAKRLPKKGYFGQIVPDCPRLDRTHLSGEMAQILFDMPCLSFLYGAISHLYTGVSA